MPTKKMFTTVFRTAFMTMFTAIFVTVASVLFMPVFTALPGAATVAHAQSLPNYGPNAPTSRDSFGKPPSGTHAPASGYRAYAYRQRLHHAHHRHWRRPHPTE